MPAASTQSAKNVRVYQLANPMVQLDVTSDPWNVDKDSASLVIGRNVVHPGVFGPEGGRFPVGSSIPESDRPVVAAFGLDFKDPVRIRFRDSATERGDQGVGAVIIPRYTVTEVDTDNDGVNDATAVKRLPQATHELVNRYPTAWPAEMVDALFFENEDGRIGEIQKGRILDIVTTTEIDDTIRVRPVGLLTLTASDANEDYKLTSVYIAERDLRGVLATNGRKFWIIQSGSAQQVLDLGSDDFLGLTWDMARIHPHLIMLTHPKYAPRILRLDAELGNTTVATNESLAGLITPTKPEFEEYPGEQIKTSWAMAATTGGNITGLAAGDGGASEEAKCRIKVRGVNLEDNAESEFVDVYAGQTLLDYLSVAEGNLVYVFNYRIPQTTGVQKDWSPPFHERWTHLEVWRTTALGVDYFLEKRVTIIDQQNEWASADGNIVEVLITQDVTAPGTNGDLQTCALSDEDLTGLPQMLRADRNSGRTPPICQRVASLEGVTICGGKADAGYTNPVAYGSAFRSIAYKWTTTTTSIFVDSGGPFTNYVYRPGDLFEVTASDGNVLGLGRYPITAKTDTNTIVVPTLPGTTVSIVSGHILRPFEIEWSRIESDEEIWHSRTDKFAPESFTTDKIIMSQIGDVFKSFTNVGRYIAVLYRSGVHLLHRAGLTLEKTTVGFNQGTPWADSVVATEETVLWAHPDGIRTMKVFQDINERGNRAEIKDFGTAITRSWFREAFDNDWDIDSGVDELNGCVRWRRKEDSNGYQVLQFSLRTQKFTLLDDDNGVAYAKTAKAETEETTVSHLYSVDSSGAAFRVNYQGTEDAYPDVTVDDVLDDTYQFSGVRIMKQGAFLASMLGDTVRFYSDTESVDEVSRVITGATVDEIRFDEVTELAEGDRFVVGAVRFKVKHPVIMGTSPSTIKTVEGVRVHAHPGPRNTKGDWPDTVPGKISVRSYDNFNDVPFDEKANEITVFEDDADGKTDQDRISALDGQGRAIEIEVEQVGARSDFRIELVEVRVREETSEIGDVD